MSSIRDVADLVEYLSHEMQKGQFVQYARVVARAVEAAGEYDPPIRVIWAPCHADGIWPGVHYKVFSPEDNYRWKLHTETQRANVTNFGLEACVTALGTRNSDHADAAFAIYLELYLVPNLELNGVSLVSVGLGCLEFVKAVPAT